jgi:protein TonB
MMKRAVIISVAAHAAVLFILWQVSQSLSRPAPRGYPRLITATLVAKPAGGGATAASVRQPIAAEPKPAPAPTPKFQPVEEKKEPAKVSAKVQPPKKSPNTKPPETKPNAPSASRSINPSDGRGNAATKTGAGSSASGSGGNALKLDVVDFPFPHYITLVQYRIESNWEPQVSGLDQLLATVYFKIKRDGEIEEIKLEQSSGNVLFDQAARRAVYNANPLPPLPADFEQPTLGVHFDFVAN